MCCQHPRCRFQLTSIDVCLRQNAGVALLLATANHDYQFLAGQLATNGHGGGRGGGRSVAAGANQLLAPAPGILTDGLAYSQIEGCVRFAKSVEATRIRVNLTTSVERGLVAPFRLASGFRAYFLNLDSDAAKMPDAVSVECTYGWTLPAGNVAHERRDSVTNVLLPAARDSNRTVVVLAPATKYPSKGKMVIYDAHILDGMMEATTCEFKIEHPAANILIAEIEVYE